MVGRKNVTWKTGEKPAAIRKEYRLYTPDTPIKPGKEELYEATLVPGNMFTAAHPMSPQVDPTYFYPSVYPYLFADLHDPKIPWGAVAIYAGMTRTEELRHGSVARVPRHTFIIDGRQYLLTNLNLVSPVI